MQNFGGQTSCVMGDVQMANTVELWKTKMHSCLT